MLQSNKQLKSLLLLACSLVFCSCGAKYKESIAPIYQAQALQLQDEHVQYPSTINPTTVDPSAVTKAEQTIFGWIPIVGSVLELPIDLTTALIPPLPSTSYPALPKDAAWNDPRIMSIVYGLRLGAGSIRVTPPALRGADWKPEKCWFFWDCADVQISDFLKEVRVYLLFKDAKVDPSNPPSTASPAKAADSPQILLASANTDTDYDKSAETLYFNVSQENMRPYLDQYDRFEVKLVASGGFPPRTVYLDGKLRLDLDLKLSGN